MHHYITVFAKTDAGHWLALFPDFPDCEAGGESLDATTVSAIMTLTQHAHNRGLPLPRPKSLSEVQGDAEWMAGRGIAFEKAILSLTPLSGFQEHRSVEP
jgi:predicted RNase H-like HicB family nuclease